MLALLAPHVPLAYLVARFAVARARRCDVPDWRGVFDRLRRMEEESIGITSMADGPCLKGLQQSPPQGPPCPAVGIEEYAHSPRSNPHHVH